METQGYREILKNELERRMSKNPHYSLRAFAQGLNVNPGGLSSILNNKKEMGTKLAMRVVDNLGLSAQQRNHFLKSVHAEKAKRLNYPEAQLPSSQEEELSLDQFKVLGEWYHLAIMEMTFLPDFKNCPQYLSKKLGINQMSAKLALARLLRIGLLKNEAGKIVKTNKFLSIEGKDKTNGLLINLQRDFLNKAIESLENDPIEQRCFEGMTFSIDESKMEYARSKIINFIQELSQELETGNISRLYQMNIALYPLSKENQNED
jgi:uncharacterized protein (TIGR02147 family)